MSGTIPHLAIGSLVLACGVISPCQAAQTPPQPSVESRNGHILEIGGQRFRDLNRNGSLDPYEDWRQGPQARTADLLGRMTLEEKAGQMFYYRFDMKSKTGALSGDQQAMAEAYVNELHVGFLKNQYRAKSPAGWKQVVVWHNRIQAMAESTRLGVPIMWYAYGKWRAQCSAAALAATRDPALARRYGAELARRYRAVGIHEFHPVYLGVGTDPRWWRIGSTFGEDADLCAKMVVAVIDGMQGRVPNPRGMVFFGAHFPGGGPQKGGRDPHWRDGKETYFRGEMLDYHMTPWKAAIEYGLYRVMPYYGIPVGVDSLSANFSKKTLDGLLRERLGFTGSVLSDFDCEGRAWGVRGDRMATLFNAGDDVWCENRGVKRARSCVKRLLALVQSGAVTEKRVNEAAGRNLKLKFQLGLFDDPYTDPEAAPRIFRSKEGAAITKDVAEAAAILLKNNGVLPLKPGARVGILRDGFDAFPGELAAAGVTLLTEKDWAEADALFLLVRPKKRGWAQDVNLDFDYGRYQKQMAKLRTFGRPIVVLADVRRPWLLGPILNIADAIVGLPGSKPPVDCLVGARPFGGKVPVTLPRNVPSLSRQREDVPFDLPERLWPYGFGMTGREPATPTIERRNRRVDEKGVIHVEVRSPEHDTFTVVTFTRDGKNVAAVPVGLKAGTWYTVRSDWLTHGL